MLSAALLLIQAFVHAAPRDGSQYEFKAHDSIPLSREDLFGYRKKHRKDGASALLGSKYNDRSYPIEKRCAACDTMCKCRYLEIEVRELHQQIRAILRALRALKTKSSGLYASDFDYTMRDSGTGADTDAEHAAYSKANAD